MFPNLIYVVGTVLSSTTNNAPSIDLTFTVGIIIIIGTAASSIFVAIINNIFQLFMKKHDLKYQTDFNELQLKIKQTDYENLNQNKSLEFQNQISFREMENTYNLRKYQWETYYKTATEIFSNMLTNVGKYLAEPTNLSQYEIAVSCIYQSFAFANDDLYGFLHILIDDLYKLANPSDKLIDQNYAIHEMETCAVEINKMLTKFMQE